jgi:hypothetical protein
MAVVHLQIEIDSDVHPELHAVLASLSKSPSQAERLRQLAASGLIWEHLRVKAQPDAAAVVAATAPRVRKDDVPPSAMRAPRPLAPANERAFSAGGVGGSETAAGEFPVLRDAIDASNFQRSPRVASKSIASAAPTARRSASMPAAQRNKGPLDVADVQFGAVHQSVAAVTIEETVRPSQGMSTTATRSPDEVFAGAPDGDDGSLPARKVGTRSRLMRMREKGLFNNGPDH